MTNGVPKIITIGSATMDVFVECEDANIVSVSTKDHNSSFMSYPYGSKVEMTDFASNVGGGGVNTAINFANLGFSTGAVFKIGDDIYSAGILSKFKDTDVDLSYIIQDKTTSTGFSIILVSFQGDRTVLAHRGANAEIRESEIKFEAMKDVEFIYIAPLNGESNKVLLPITKFARENDIKICFNAGTTSIKKGFEYIKEVLKSAQIVVMNKEEASMATGIKVRPDTRDTKYSEEKIHPDVKEMLKALKICEKQIVVITDGGAGAYAYDGDKFYYCPVFPGKVVSTLGAGDAFASTFCAALGVTGKDIGKSLEYASVNSGSVVANFGATEGFLTFDEIKQKLETMPEYKSEVVE